MTYFLNSTPIKRIYEGEKLVYEAPAFTSLLPDKQPLTAFIPGLVTGDRIELFRAANIRREPIISTSTLIGVNASGMRGTIRGGPTTGISNSIWYDINFDGGHDGWCVSDNYTQITSTVIQATPGTFRVDDKVRLIRRSNVRATASLTGNLLRVADANSEGTITQGPVLVNNINWYRVDFETGTDGFVASDNFALVYQTPTGYPFGPQPAGQTRNVSTSAALATAISQSQTGDIILVAPGNYTPLSQAYLKGTTTSGYITIRSADRNNPARFPTGLGSRNHRGIVFDNFLVGPATPPAIGNRTVVGIGGRLTRCMVRNCLFDNCDTAIAFTAGGIQNVIEANEITRWQNDGIRLYEGHRWILIRNNYWHHPALANNHDHADILQAAQNTREGYHEDVIIEYNRCYGGNESYKRTQGFLLRPGHIVGQGANPIPGVTPTLVAHPEDYPRYAWKRWRIRHNYIENEHIHGIFLAGHVDLECTGNVLRNMTNTTEPSRQAGITVQGPNSGRVWNNVQRRSSINLSTNTPTPGRLSDFSQWQVTMGTNTALPTGWVMPNAGRFTLG